MAGAKDNKGNKYEQQPNHADAVIKANPKHPAQKNRGMTAAENPATNKDHVRPDPAGKACGSGVHFLGRCPLENTAIAQYAYPHIYIPDDENQRDRAQEQNDPDTEKRMYRK